MTPPMEHPAGKYPPAVVVGNFKVMYRPGIAFESTRAKLVQQGYQVQETSRFLLASSLGNTKTTLVHRFAPEEIDNTIPDYLLQELGQLMISDQAFSEALIGIVDSVIPGDPKRAWNLFSLNTLNHLREKINSSTEQAGQPNSITAFATIYRRLLELRRGSSLLDVGCACAFWPILAAEREAMGEGRIGRIVGIDNRQTAINLSKNLAALLDASYVEFAQVDVLTSDFVQLGTFDTVTAIHLIEHLSDEQLPVALQQMLQVTSQRLIIAVPYEQQATAAYGHEQVFTPDILKQWGQSCVDWLGGAAHFWCEEVAGGLLVVDRENK